MREPVFSFKQTYDILFCFRPRWVRSAPKPMERVPRPSGELCGLAGSEVGIARALPAGSELQASAALGTEVFGQRPADSLPSCDSNTPIRGRQSTHLTRWVALRRVEARRAKDGSRDGSRGHFGVLCSLACLELETVFATQSPFWKLTNYPEVWNGRE